MLSSMDRRSQFDLTPTSFRRPQSKRAHQQDASPCAHDVQLPSTKSAFEPLTLQPLPQTLLHLFVWLLGAVACLPPRKFAARVNSCATELADEGEPSANVVIATKAIKTIGRNVWLFLEALVVERKIRARRSRGVNLIGCSELKVSLFLAFSRRTKVETPLVFELKDKG